MKTIRILFLVFLSAASSSVSAHTPSISELLSQKTIIIGTVTQILTEEIDNPYADSAEMAMGGLNETAYVKVHSVERGLYINETIELKYVKGEGGLALHLKEGVKYMFFMYGNTRQVDLKNDSYKIMIPSDEDEKVLKDCIREYKNIEKQKPKKQRDEMDSMLIKYNLIELTRPYHAEELKARIFSKEKPLQLSDLQKTELEKSVYNAEVLGPDELDLIDCLGLNNPVSLRAYYVNHLRKSDIGMSVELMSRLYELTPTADVLTLLNAFKEKYSLLENITEEFKKDREKFIEKIQKN